MKRKIKNIVLHCSASSFGNAVLIDQWHKERGWKGIGYHYVVLNGFIRDRQAKTNSRWAFLDGSVECGRPLDKSPYLTEEEVGAHVSGFNHNSIGICLIGHPNRFSIRQFYAVRSVISALRWEFDIPLKNILGNHELNSKKLCPGLNMDYFRKYITDDRNIELLIGELYHACA